VVRVTHRGGCHCGRVRFEVDAPAEISVHACNCSICSMSAYLHLLVLDPATITRRIVTPFDGAKWEANVGALRDEGS
jgi:hypothetical protein